MKLRNRRTGKIIENACIGVFRHQSSGDCKRVDTEARSLEKVLEEWEDYEPEEPKITDPEWRHVVRKWYELNDLEGKLRVRVDVKNYKIIGWRKEEDVYGQEIDIPLSVMECEIDPFDGTGYTIDELCGEEEE